MKVAIYARVSTADKEQDPETQLIAVRFFCEALGWTVHREYVDRASAMDLRHRQEWRTLLDDAARRRFQMVVVFRLDRAFRSVKEMHETLAAWGAVGVDFTSVRERFETSTALGRLLLNLLASLAEFELEMISERVRAGMDRAKREGKQLGRRSVWDRPGFEAQFWKALEALTAGNISKGEAASQLKIGHATLNRELRRLGLDGSDLEGE